MLAPVSGGPQSPEPPRSPSGDDGSQESSIPFRDGEIIAGKYEVDRVLGQGGMGVVVSAHHIALQQKVAIKLLLPATMRIPGAAQRFLREARSAVAIQSEHVARVLDVGTLESGPPYMVMEYLTGSDLGDLVRARGRLPVSEAVDYVLQACEAIAEAHARGIVHRDLKPDNIFLTRRADGSALIKVLDFGLSKPTADEATGPATPSLTGANMVAGSPQYMSPEQVRGLKNADHRADIWALGIILYELLTGRRPFDADTIAGVFAKVAADAPLRPRALRPDLPSPLETAILRCLEKDVERRMPDVAELAACLHPFAPAESSTSVDRIARLGGVARSAGHGVSGHPSAPSLNSHAGPSGASPPHAAEPSDALEADIPTMAAPGIQSVSNASAPRASAPLPARPPSAPVARSVGTASPSGGHARSAPTPAVSPIGDSLSPPGQAGLSRTPALHEIDLDYGPKAPHPAERGRRPGRLREEDEPRAAMADLQLGPPIAVLVVAILVAAADMVLVRLTGNTVSLGPVRPLWLAGPLALLGAAWLVSRILRR